MARRASSRTALSSATSVGTAIASPPAATHSSATVSSASARRAAATTPQPDSAKQRAVARPIPLDAPVTTAIFMGSRGTPGLLDETSPRSAQRRADADEVAAPVDEGELPHAVVGGHRRHQPAARLRLAGD